MMENVPSLRDLPVGIAASGARREHDGMHIAVVDLVDGTLLPSLDALTSRIEAEAQQWMSIP
jgi:fumarate hydratase class II